MKYLKIALEFLPKLLLILSCLVFLIPYFGMIVETIVAYRFGVKGFVYYEATENRNVTKDSNLYLLRSDEVVSYNSIHIGDKLQSSSAVHFRNAPGKASDIIFVLRTGECVIVVSPPNVPINVKMAKFGGWLEVATTNCGLFR